MAFLVNVPNVPGVPPVAFAAASAGLSLLTSDAASLVGGIFGAQRWGIYNGAAAVVIAETITTFDYRESYTISDFPVERGAFESYDKVYVPFEGTFRFIAGKSEAARTAMLASIKAIAGDLNLYTIVTPEAIYPSVNIVDYDYRRAANSGLGLLAVDVRVEQVAVVAQAQTTNTASPNNASQVNGGPVQTTPATSAESSQIGSIVGPPSLPNGITGF